MSKGADTLRLPPFGYGTTMSGYSRGLKVWKNRSLVPVRVLFQNSHTFGSNSSLSANRLLSLVAPTNGTSACEPSVASEVSSIQRTTPTTVRGEDSGLPCASRPV